MSHPDNDLDKVDPEYQVKCLLAKMDSIEKSERLGDKFYDRKLFLYVLKEGYSLNFPIDVSFDEIRKEIQEVMISRLT
jgi:hypothetical protein